MGRLRSRSQPPLLTHTQSCQLTWAGSNANWLPRRVLQSLLESLWVLEGGLAKLSFVCGPNNKAIFALHSEFYINLAFDTCSHDR